MYQLQFNTRLGGSEIRVFYSIVSVFLFQTNEIFNRQGWFITITRCIVEDSIALVIEPQISLNLKSMPVGLAMYFGEGWMPK